MARLASVLVRRRPLGEGGLHSRGYERPSIQGLDTEGADEL